MGDRDRTIEKLKKLYAHAKSAEAIGSEAEAATFAAKVQELLAQHNVDSAVLEDDEDEKNPIVDVIVEGLPFKRRRISWQHTLGDCVSYAHFCNMLVSATSNHLWFVGRRMQAEAAIEVFLFLVKTAEEIADKEYVKFFYECRAAGDVTKARGFRQSFLQGFARRMRDRYLQELDKIEQEAAKQAGALVLFKSEREQVQEYIDEMFKGRELKVLHLLSLDAYDVSRKPSLRLLFRQGNRWGIVQGEKKLLNLYRSPAEAERGKSQYEKEVKPPRVTDTNREGRKRGTQVADKLDLSVQAKTRKEIA
jgi:hypothetical protein